MRLRTLSSNVSHSYVTNTVTISVTNTVSDKPSPASRPRASMRLRTLSSNVSHSCVRGMPGLAMVRMYERTYKHQRAAAVAARLAVRQQIFAWAAKMCDVARL
jgi:hypothetical protein